MTSKINFDLLAACKAQHQAIDTLFAMIMSRDSTFYPSKSGHPWEAVVMGHAAIKKAEGATRRWRHVKRGTTYTEIGRAELQAARDVIEGMTFVVYRGEDGKLWVRQEDEFEDGRFEEMS